MSMTPILSKVYEKLDRYVNEKRNNKSGKDATWISAASVQQKSQFRKTESTESKNKESFLGLDKKKQDRL